MTNNAHDDKDDAAHAETMNHGKSSQKKGGSSRDKKRSKTNAQGKSGGRGRGGTKSGETVDQQPDQQDAWISRV